jgi:hypothetical protein
VSIDPKVSNELAVAFDETNIDAETTTDEETKNAITDENNDARDDTENLDKNIENKADSPEDLDKENKEDTDYIFIGDKIEKSEDDECKKIRLAKVLAIAAGGGTALGGATSGISKLVKSSGDGKKDEPSPEPTSEPKPKPEPKPEPEPEPEPNKKEEKGGFGEWYKNNPLKAGLLTFVGIVLIVVLAIFLRKHILLSKKAEALNKDIEMKVFNKK